MMVAFNLNGKQVSADVAPDTPLLWVLRDTLGMTGTKFGCGKALCGACTVHLNGQATRSCQIPIGSVAGQKVTTIEGIPMTHPVKKAWVALDVPQCGYCQSGQMMSAAALLASNRKPTSTRSCRETSAVAARTPVFARRSSPLRRNQEANRTWNNSSTSRLAVTS
jgi:isoquinoline 1-oxidoreductase subunit alpha